jgi:hypothetical protein
MKLKALPSINRPCKEAAVTFALALMDDIKNHDNNADNQGGALPPEQQRPKRRINRRTAEAVAATSI